MTDESLQVLYAQLVREEGMQLAAYRDTKGNWTIGAGRLIDGRKGGGITRDEALYLLRNDVARTEKALDGALPWWRGLDEARQRVLVDMAFNMGLGFPRVGGLLSFSGFLDYLQEKDYDRAAEAMLNSDWAHDLKQRSAYLAEIIRNGAAAAHQ